MLRAIRRALCSVFSINTDVALVSLWQYETLGPFPLGAMGRLGAQLCIGEKKDIVLNLLVFSTFLTAGEHV